MSLKLQCQSKINSNMKKITLIDIVLKLQTLNIICKKNTSMQHKLEERETAMHKNKDSYREFEYFLREKGQKFKID